MTGSLAYLSFVRCNDWAGVIKVVLDDWYPKITTVKEAYGWAILVQCMSNL